MEQGLCREEHRCHVDAERSVAPLLRNPLGLTNTSFSHTITKYSYWVEIRPDTAHDVLDESGDTRVRPSIRRGSIPPPGTRSLASWRNRTVVEKSLAIGSFWPNSEV